MENHGSVRFTCQDITITIKLVSGTLNPSVARIAVHQSPIPTVGQQV